MVSKVSTARAIWPHRLFYLLSTIDAKRLRGEREKMKKNTWEGAHLSGPSVSLLSLPPVLRDLGKKLHFNSKVCPRAQHNSIQSLYTVTIC